MHVCESRKVLFSILTCIGILPVLVQCNVFAGAIDCNSKGGSSVRPAQDSGRLPAKSYEMQAKEYLKSILYTRQEIKDWINGKRMLSGVWERNGEMYQNVLGRTGETYDSLLGWLHINRVERDGVDGSKVTYSYAGARRMIMYEDKPCRINTYGDSFTHCDQVSDGETWQEVLAAHLCEPVRNFGVGGFSVYQAYLRMKQEETRTPAKYIIFNIYCDDHYRNLHAWRNIREGYTPKDRQGSVLSPPKPYVRVNLSTGEFKEFPNPCPTRESAYNLCDLDWVYNTFKDDFVLRIILAQRNVDNNSPADSYADIAELAWEQGFKMQIDSKESLQNAIDTIYTKAAIFATMRIVEKVEKYAAEHDKKVLYVLSYDSDPVKKAIQEGTRFDQEFVDFLNRKKLPYVDLMEAHLKDFAKFSISCDEYAERYWIGHYNPRGNFFEAFAIKPKLVEMLEPKPIPYSN
jgi:hypothetical protein